LRHEIETLGGSSTVSLTRDIRRNHSHLTLNQCTIEQHLIEEGICTNQLSGGWVKTSIKAFNVTVVTCCGILICEKDLSVAVGAARSVSDHFQIIFSIRVTYFMFLRRIQEDVSLAIPSRQTGSHSG
jgi:hypothetical protein